MALLAVALSFMLAVVACRVTGETGITPIGALGKVTQLTFGLIAPGNMAANLMTANVTGGAAGQSADLMTDLRTGYDVGATPRLQIIAQSFGILVGSVVGTLCLSGADPRSGHDADHAANGRHRRSRPGRRWRRPWRKGLETLPPSALVAIAIAAPIGFALALAEHLLPRAARALSAKRAGVRTGFRHSGLEFDLAFSRRGARGACLRASAPTKPARYTLPVAAGLVAGESLMGIVTIAIYVLK